MTEPIIKTLDLDSYKLEVKHRYFAQQSVLTISNDKGIVFQQSLDGLYLALYKKNDSEVFVFSKPFFKSYFSKVYFYPEGYLYHLGIDENKKLSIFPFVNQQGGYLITERRYKNLAVYRDNHSFQHFLIKVNQETLNQEIIVSSSKIIFNGNVALLDDDHIINLDSLKTVQIEGKVLKSKTSSTDRYLVVDQGLRLSLFRRSDLDHVKILNLDDLCLAHKIYPYNLSNWTVISDNFIADNGDKTLVLDLDTEKSLMVKKN